MKWVPLTTLCTKHCTTWVHHQSVFGAVLVLQKPCGFFVPFDVMTMMRMMMRMMVMTFFDWTTTNLCDAAQIAERAAASGLLRNHESLWEKLVNCNSF